VALDPESAADFRRAIADAMDAALAREEVRTALAADGHAEATWAAAIDGGWLDVLIPIAAGGAGLGLEDYGPVLFEAGSRLFGEPLIEHGAAAFALASHVPGALEALGSRPTALADAGALGLPLPKLEGGALTAELPAVRFASTAKTIVLAFESESSRPEVALTSADHPSIAIDPLASFDPYSGYARLGFDAWRPRPDDVIVSGELAEALLADLRAGARILAACELAGLAHRALEMSVDYSRERQQFRRPIGSFQAVQQLLADMAMRALSLRALCNAGARRADREPTALPQLARVLKAYAASAARSVVEGALQVHGGIAFTTEFPLGAYYSHVLALEGWYGGRRELARQLGEQLIRGELVPG
jgi:alkylation response protein AidB-like acyl-CoA dehydrogenase